MQYSPGNNILLFQLAGLLTTGERCPEALDTMAPAIAMRWQYPHVYPLYGWCAVQTGRTAEAMPVLREAAGFERRHPRVFGLLEAMALASGDVGEAANYQNLYLATHQPPGISTSLAPVFVKLGRDVIAGGEVGRAVQLLSEPSS